MQISIVVQIRAWSALPDMYYLYGVLIAAAVDFFFRTRCLIPDFCEKAHTYILYKDKHDCPF